MRPYLLKTDECFKVRLCVELLAARHAWRRKSARVLELSRPALDLSPQQEQIILDADNGSWEVVEGDEESLLVIHWCVGAYVASVANLLLHPSAR